MTPCSTYLNEKDSLRFISVTCVHAYHQNCSPYQPTKELTSWRGDEEKKEYNAGLEWEELL
jgi:hypothetical protein